MPQTMQAVSSHELGPLENYRLTSVPVPEPGPDQVRIRVAAAGLGYADGLLCEGRYQVKPAVPFIPGCEFAGTVEALGANVTDLAVGDRVAGQAMGGGLAELALADRINVTPLPDVMSFTEAAVFWVDYATAFYALHNRGALQPGETVLVLGAAGGLGLAAIQIAKALGARVIGAASTAEKRDVVLGAGADAVIDYTTADWRTQLKSLVGVKGLDIVFDPVGGTTFEPAFRSLAWGGRHLVIGFTGGSIPALPINLALLKGASLVGVDIRQFSMLYEPETAAAEKLTLARMVAEGALQPRVGRCFSLQDFAQALRSCSARERVGKTIVQILP